MLFLVNMYFCLSINMNPIFTETCEAGQKLTVNLDCADCLAGQYSPGGTTQRCSDCPAGTTSDAGSAGSASDCKFFVFGNVSLHPVLS